MSTPSLIDALRELVAAYEELVAELVWLLEDGPEDGFDCSRVSRAQADVMLAEVAARREGATP